MQRCIKLRDKDGEYDACVCLVDVDTHARLQEAIRLAKAEEIMLVVSRLKFEQWLRWHAETARSALSSAALDRRVTELGLVTKKHLSPKFPFEKVDQACAVSRAADPEMAAGRVGPDPSSAMPLLVHLMRVP